MSLENILEVIKTTDSHLCEAYHASLLNQSLPRGIPVFFPKTRDGAVRVSEQEAKLLFVVNLSRHDLACSPETPTQELYAFTEDAKGKRSAQTDLAVCSATGAAMLNMEFKSGGWSAERQDRSQIRKDIEKLLREPVNGLWFHTLRKADAQNVARWWDVVCNEMQEVINQWGGKFPQKTLIFHISILQQRISFERHLTIGCDPIPTEWAKAHSMLEYEIDGESLRIVNPNGWLVNQCGHPRPRQER